MTSTDTKDAAAPAPEAEKKNEPFSAADVASEIAAAKERQAESDAEKARKVEEEQKELHNAFLDQELHDDVWDRLRARIRTAIKDGESEVKVVEFPAAWCEDKGRAINNGLDNWPDTLTGHARRAYEFWETEMKDRGFTLHAAVTSYPEGMPGDVALFLGWQKGEPEA